MKVRDSKEMRLRFIERTLAENQINDQESLAHLLSEAGFTVTQSSVSRDLHELGVSKVNGRYTAARRSDSLIGGLQSAVPAGPNLVVLKTDVGAAQAVAYKLDQSHLSQIVGTIAGDDTIFVATASAEAQESLLFALGVKQ